jgi:prolyl oligopeptidase
MIDPPATKPRKSMTRPVAVPALFYDMLQVENDPNGAFNTTEFGTIKDEAQFDALYAYSPYHHVVDGTAYPVPDPATRTGGSIRCSHAR